MPPIIGFSTIYLRYRRTDPAIRPRLMIDLLLWICSTLMLAFALYIDIETAALRTFKPNMKLGLGLYRRMRTNDDPRGEKQTGVL